MTKLQEAIIKKIEELCAKLVQIYLNRDNGGDGDWLRKRSEILKEIKNQILKDLTLWELDLEGNIQPVLGVSVNTTGAGGGYILFGYEPGTSYIHFFNEFNENYHDEITHAFVEEIKQNPQDWKIIVEDEREVPFAPEPMTRNTKDHQVVKHKSGRRHNRGYQWYKNAKPGFSDQEWMEIKSVVKKQQQPEKGNHEQPKKSSKFPPELITAGIIIGLLGVIVSVIIYKSRNKKAIR